jgi:hypothetical protein
VNRLIAKIAAPVSQEETWTLHRAAHQRRANAVNVVSTWVNALISSAWECRVMMTCFCSFIRLIDDTNGHLRFELLLGAAGEEVQ